MAEHSDWRRLNQSVGRGHCRREVSDGGDAIRAKARAQSFGERGGARPIYIVNQQPCYADLQRGAGYGRPRAARAEQDYLVARDVGKAAPEAFGKPPAISVVPDSFAC